MLDIISKLISVMECVVWFLHNSNIKFALSFGNVINKNQHLMTNYLEDTVFKRWY